MDLSKIKHLQLDALKEIAHIGTGHAATALSQMVRHQINLKVPNANIMELDNLTKILSLSEEIIAIQMNILGDVTGKIFIIFSYDSAHKLANMLLQRETENLDDFDELTRSALAETGNILAGSYLNALNVLLKLLLLVSIPTVYRSDIDNILQSVYASEETQERLVICLETEFSSSKHPMQIKGWFLLIPDVPALEVILEALELY